MAETAEQLAALREVAALEIKRVEWLAKITTARLQLVGLCRRRQRPGPRQLPDPVSGRFRPGPPCHRGPLMRWVSHIAIAAAICATVNPFAVPAAILGSTAPDWLEPVLSVVQRRQIRHRGITHHPHELAGPGRVLRASSGTGAAGCCGLRWVAPSIGFAMR